MAAPSPCVPCCNTPQSVNVPGVEGEPGTDGSNGQSAYTLTTADFVIPAINSNVTISVQNSDWIALGQVVVADGPAHFQVVSLPGSTSIELKFLGYPNDLSAGGTISMGAKIAAAGVLASTNYILIRDEKANNTTGGNFVLGAWRTRDLNTEVIDTGNYATLAGNQITLSAGTYRIRAKCPAYQVGSHQCRLQNISDGTTIALGTTEATAAADAVTTSSWLDYRFTLATAKILEMQHQCTATDADGFGLPANIGNNEIYTTVELIREAA